MSELKDKVLELVKRNGPILPVKIAKVVDKDVLFTSALLSELVSNKLIKLTYQNFGGSPLYYVLGQEGKLEVLYNALADKEKEAYKLLKKECVLVDNELEPAIRVALRNMKDFARLMKVNYKDTELMIWRWFLVDNKRFEELVKGFFVKKVVKPKAEIKEAEIKEKEEIKEEKVQLSYAMRIVDFLKPYSGKLSRTDARDLVAVQFKIGQNKALKEIAKLVKANYLSVDRKEHNKQLLIVNAN